MAKKPKAEDQDAEQGASGVRAVDRAIAILQCFTPDQPAMSVIEIQKRVGLSAMSNPQARTSQVPLSRITEAGRNALRLAATDI